MALTPFPVGLPTEAIMIIIDKLRGSNVENNDLILASWNLVGYGLAQLSPKIPVGASLSTADTLSKLASDNDISNDEAIAALESLIPKGDGREIEGKVPWVRVISIAAKILLGLLLV